MCVWVMKRVVRRSSERLERMQRDFQRILRV